MKCLTCSTWIFTFSLVRCFFLASPFAIIVYLHLAFCPNFVLNIGVECHEMLGDNVWSLHRIIVMLRAVASFRTMSRTMLIAPLSTSTKTPDGLMTEPNRSLLPPPTETAGEQPLEATVKEWDSFILRAEQ